MKKIILFTIVFSFFSKILPQSCDYNLDKIIINASCMSGINSGLAQCDFPVTGRDQVTLAAGFSLNNTSGHKFIVNTDNSKLCQLVNYSAETPGNVRPLDQTNCVPGTIGGTINVGPSGAATYSLPIAVSPGSHGMQPGLSIFYSSQGGNGLLGYGWNLSGLSSIMPVNKNPYYDNSTAPVTLTSADALALDGQRLINTGTNTFSPENDPYTVVTYYPSENYYKVATKDGMIIEYGNTSEANNSKFYPKDVTTTPYCWSISKIQDPEGNYIKYYYLKDATLGEYRIDEIKYTGNGSLLPYNSVQFYYDKRTDVSRFYTAGKEINHTILLTSIKVFAEGNLSYDYGFTYFNDSLYSKLNQIALMANGTKYNPTIVNWGSSPNYSTTIVDDGPSFGSLYNNQMYFGDINGDGKTDVIKKFNLHPIISVFLSTGGGSYSTPIAIGYPNVSDIQIVDWNNDGKDEIMIHTVDSLNLKDKVVAYTLNGSSLNVLGEINYSTVPKSDKFKYFYSDFDNNGKIDRLVVKNGTLIACDSLGISTIPSITGINDIKLIDFNGDGQTEFLAIDTSGNGSIWKYNGTTFATIYYSVFFGKSPNVFTGDFNGDGKTDYISFSGSSWGIYYSTGTGFASGTMPSGFKSYEPAQTGQLDSSKMQWYSSSDCNDIVTSVPYAAIYKPATTVYIDDLNNDGKSDIIYTCQDTLSVFISSGNSFIQVNTFKISNATDQNSIFLQTADLNGNNQKEIIYGNDDNPYGAYAVIVDCPRSAEFPDGRQIIEYVLYPGTALHENYKTITFNTSLDTALYANTITNGNNITTTIAYSPVFSNTSGIRNYPVIPIVNPLHLAVNITSTDLNTQQVLSNVNYTFQNSYTHEQGLGFLCFTTVTSSNILSKDSTSTIFNYTISDYTGHTCYFTWPYKQSSYIHGINASLVTNSMKAIGGNAINKFFVPVTVSSAANDFIKGYTTTNSIVAFDSNLGRVTDQTTVTSDGWTVETKPLYESVTISGVTGKFSRCSQVITTRTMSSNTYTLTNTFIYGNSLLPLRLASQTSQGKVTTTYNSWDNYGNVTGATVSVTDGTPSRTTNTTYDSYGRFPLSSTNFEAGLTSTSTYRANDGAVLSQTDPNGLVTSYSYSSGGNSIISACTLPDGNVSTTTVGWDGTGTGLFYTEKKVTNGNTVTGYFNAAGQKLKETSLGYLSAVMTTTYSYNSDGSLLQVLYPGISTPTVYTYWPDGRLKTETGLNKSLSYSYYYLSTTITDNIMGLTKTQTTDAMGNVTSITATTGNINYSYFGSGKVKDITTVGTGGSTTSMTYDPLTLDQLTLTDPNAGTTNYSYNGFGQLKTQTDAKGQIINIGYDAAGRCTTKTCTSPAMSDSFVYSTTAGKKGLLQRATRDGVTETYKYDALCRTTSVTTTGDSKTFVNSCQYDPTTGRLSSASYPSGLSVIYIYDDVGNLKQINNAATGLKIWAGDNQNTAGQWVQYSLGNGLITNWTYDSKKMLNSISTGYSGSIQNLNFTFNDKGQLTQRTDGSLSEGFHYDAMDRLDSSQVTGSTKFLNNYQTNGNINSTTLAGQYTYGNSAHPHAVTALAGAFGSTGQSNAVNATATYNAENKVASIISGSYGNTEYKNEFTYGVDGNRFKVNFYENGGIKRSKIYIGNSEFGYNSSGGPAYKRTIIYAPTGVCAVYQDSGNVQEFYYIHSDYLGSWLAITNSTGTVKNRYSYDAWGRTRSPVDWKLKDISTTTPLTSLANMQPRFDRGYTGHEMMCAFGLINMNGRVYDPYLQRFLSPDKVVQAPGNAQNYNRYSYCLNNPLRYTDPTGNYVQMRRVKRGGEELGMDDWLNEPMVYALGNPLPSGPGYAHEAGPGFNDIYVDITGKGDYVRRDEVTVVYNASTDAGDVQIEKIYFDGTIDYINKNDGQLYSYNAITGLGGVYDASSGGGNAMNDPDVMSYSAGLLGGGIAKLSIQQIMYNISMLPIGGKMTGTEIGILGGFPKIKASIDNITRTDEGFQLNLTLFGSGAVKLLTDLDNMSGSIFQLSPYVDSKGNEVMRITSETALYRDKPFNLLFYGNLMSNNNGYFYFKPPF
jgi:RHS repeat-associated protein